MQRSEWTKWGAAVFSLLMLPLVAVSWEEAPTQDPPRKNEITQGSRNEPPGKGGRGVTFGGPGGQPERKLVKQFDKDGDGRLNREEREAARKFVKSDPAGGRRFGPRGGFNPGAMVATPLLQALDTGKDDQVSKDELVAGIKKFFKDADKEGKSLLTGEQLSATLERIFPRPTGPGGPGGPPRKEGNPPVKGDGPPGKGGPPEKQFGGPGGGMFRVAPPGTLLGGEIVKRADKNKDGKVTEEELTDAARALFTESDKDKDGKLGSAELSDAVAKLLPAPTFGPGGSRANTGPAKPGPKVTPADVKNYPNAPLYEPTVLRTLFIEFEGKDWEAELADFYRSDVEVPATLTVDGKKYPNVGVHFRGASSYFSIREGYKKSMNLAMDFADADQRLYGFKTLNLLNCNDDPSFLNSVLYSHIARKYLPAPRANLVKVVINGESWGLYANVEQFNKDFVAENYKSTKGARWKVKGSPGGGGGLDYVGDKVEDYKRRYEIKTADREKDWKALIELCQVLSKTPVEQFEEKLSPILDIDGTLRFLALDIALINCDGYWIRASDYSLYRDEKGKFHIIPHDMNESFRPAAGPGFGGRGGPGGPGGPGGGRAGGGGGGDGGRAPSPQPRGVELDPLFGLDDARKPLRSRLLQVPKFREAYLKYVRQIAAESLDWKNLGPVVKRYREMIEKEVEQDTRKLYTLEAFRAATRDAAAESGARSGGMSLRAFADQRRKYLLDYVKEKIVARDE